MRGKIEILTPVHIGSGNEIGPVEYLVDNKFYRIDMDRLFEDASFDKNGFIRQAVAGNLYLGDFNAALVKKYPLYILDIDDSAWTYLKSRKPTIKEFIKSGGGVYVPGSSIKGSILSALYWRILKELAQKDPHMKSIIMCCLTRSPADLLKLPSFYRKFLKQTWNRRLKRKEFDFQETLLSLTFYYLIEESERGVFIKEWLDRKGKRHITNIVKFASWLEVGDADLTKPSESLHIILTKTVGGQKQINIPFEAVKTGSNFEFRLKTQKAAFSEDRILEIVDEFYSKVWMKDKEWAKTNNLKMDFAKLEIQKCKLKIGQGSTSFATSLLILASELGLEKEYLSKWRITKYNTEPKTRKIIVKNGKLSTLMGWAKLTLEA